MADCLGNMKVSKMDSPSGPMMEKLLVYMKGGQMDVQKGSMRARCLGILLEKRMVSLTVVQLVV